jgi:hypothetical protein
MPQLTLGLTTLSTSLHRRCRFLPLILSQVAVVFVSVIILWVIRLADSGGSGSSFSFMID